MVNPRFLRGLIFLLWFLTATAIAQPQTSRASSAASYLERGNQWMAKGEWDRAIADYDLAIAFDARAPVYNNRGLARQRKGDLAGALGDYDRAIELNPRFADGLINRGLLHAEQGDLNAAIGDFNKAIEVNPHNARVYNNRGKARQRSEERRVGTECRRRGTQRPRKKKGARQR